jgi:hypothetical protein
MLAIVYLICLAVIPYVAHGQLTKDYEAGVDLWGFQ